MNRLAMALCGAAAVALSTVAQAATIVGTPFSSPAMPVNLTSTGTLDWAYWHINSTTLLATRPPTNEKTGGSSIGTALPINGTGLRGSTTNISQISFSFTDGVSPESGSATVRGVFTNPGAVTARGIQLPVTLAEAGQEYAVSIWVSGYRSTGTLTAALPGATDYTDSTFTYADDKPARLCTLSVTPDAANSVLTLSYVTSAAADPSSHVLLGGVAVHAVPEPAALALLLPAVALGLRRRRA